jgi:hypothetical protein
MIHNIKAWKIPRRLFWVIRCSELILFALGIPSIVRGLHAYIPSRFRSVMPDAPMVDPNLPLSPRIVATWYVVDWVSAHEGAVTPPLARQISAKIRCQLTK